MKRIIMALLALLCCVGLASAEVQSYESDFTSNTDGWYGRGCSVRVTADGLLADFRKSTWNSPGRAFELVPGKQYTISVEVMQKTLDSGRFILSCERKRGEELLRHTLSGGACLNDTIMHIVNDRAPFGGVGNSGMGRYHGKESFLAFSHRRTVVATPKHFDLPLRYMPYKLFGLIKRLL